MNQIQIAVSDYISELIAELANTDYAIDALKRAIVEKTPLEDEMWSRQMVRLSRMLIRCTYRDVLSMEHPRYVLEVTFNQFPIDPHNPKDEDPFHINLQRYYV